MTSIPFVNNSAQLPLIHCMLNGKKTLALVDSGAGISMFNNLLEEQLDEVSSVKDSVSTLSGEVNLHKTAKAIITFHDYTGQPHGMKITGFLGDLSAIGTKMGKNPDSVGVLIGCDVLDRIGAKIDYRSKTLAII